MKRTLLSNAKIISRSVWFFPIILFVLVCFLSALKISGTSIGIYHQALFGEKSHDSNLIFGEPRQIRSDEWLVNTQMTLAQKNNNYQKINKNIGSGKDMSVIVDVPYKEWSVLLKPQNLVFFVLPFEQAFAFKWWFFLFLLISSVYFLSLRIVGKEKKLFSILFSLAVGFSPFIFWWYQTITLATISYGILIFILVLRIIDREKALSLKSQKLSDGLHVLALTYLLSAFALLIYPPFQIPIILSVALLTIGYLLQKGFGKKKYTKQLLKRLSLLLISGVFSLLVTGLFVSTRKEAINSITHTIYPGSRSVSSGGFNFLHLFDGFLMPRLPDPIKGVNFFDNQSEASNFILLLPFLIIPGLILLIYEYRTTKIINWLLLITEIVALILIARLFIPFGDEFYKLLFLDKVPHKRLLLGLGFVGIIQLLIIIKSLQKVEITLKKLALLGFVYTFICFLALVVVGFDAIQHNPLFITNKLKVVFLAGAFSSIIFLFIIKRFVLAAALMLCFSFVSVYQIHPLYRGVGFENTAKISEVIQSSEKDSVWVGAENIMLENIAIVYGRKSISGVEFYPDVKFWKSLDPDKEYIYNRFAHILFQDKSQMPEKVRLVQSDLFYVQISCDDFVRQNIDYIITVNKIDHSCVQLYKTIEYPTATLHTYKIIE